MRFGSRRAEPSVGRLMVFDGFFFFVVFRFVVFLVCFFLFFFFFFGLVVLALLAEHLSTHLFHLLDLLGGWFAGEDGLGHEGLGGDCE